jgi:hypothetical protein
VVFSHGSTTGNATVSRGGAGGLAAGRQEPAAAAANAAASLPLTLSKVVASAANTTVPWVPTVTAPAT